MAVFSPTRRLLGLPAWLWVVLPVPLLALGSVLGTVWLPSKLSEPPERSEILRNVVLVARQGDSFRFVPMEEQKGVKPLWAVTTIINDNGSVQWTTYRGLPGLFRRRSRWTYELTANRFDHDWKDDKKDPLTLPPEEIRRLRPLVVAELNRREPDSKAGDRLEQLLNNGLEASSSVCPQNALIVLSWLSLPMALAGLCSMFVPARKKTMTPD
jgi:hypothetical protein